VLHETGARGWGNAAEGWSNKGASPNQVWRDTMARTLLVRLTITTVALALNLVSAGRAAAHHGEDRHNMRRRRFGHLQARSSYQPVIQAQGRRWIAYVGHHGGEAFNPMTGMVEPNGTSVIDVSDPRNPQYLIHVPGAPGGTEAGGAQMVRIC